LIDILDLIELASAENNGALVIELEESLDEVHRKVVQLHMESILSAPHDLLNCFVEINAGAGGTEAQDWAYMLARMYTRWAERKGYKTEITNKNDGEEAGVKSITIHIEGNKSYGWLKKESGIHRLVRISPFDANARRHTSFASVLVTPEVIDNVEVDIREEDLRIDTYRASGAGGQHVNKTDSAVRITHVPTGIVVQCQTQRSQHQNKANAMSMLKSKIYAIKLKEKEDAVVANSPEKTDIAWGHQIRSYVLQPYQMVKDTRTGFENGNAMAVLDGGIDDFLASALSSQAC
jgi:peptide chain release factor 2